MQEGRRQEAEGRRKESLYSKLFNLFQLDSYFRNAALVKQQQQRLIEEQQRQIEAIPYCKAEPEG